MLAGLELEDYADGSANGENNEEAWAMREQIRELDYRVFCNEFTAWERGCNDAEWLDEGNGDHTDDDAGRDSERDPDRFGHLEGINEGCSDRESGDGKDAEFFDAETEDAKYDAGADWNELLPGWVGCDIWYDECCEIVADDEPDYYERDAL